MLGCSLSISWVDAHNRDILIHSRSTTNSFYHHTSPSTAASESLYLPLYPIPPASLSSQNIPPTYLKNREEIQKKQRGEGSKKTQTRRDQGTETKEEQIDGEGHGKSYTYKYCPWKINFDGCPHGGVGRG